MIGFGYNKEAATYCKFLCFDFEVVRMVRNLKVTKDATNASDPSLLTSNTEVPRACLILTYSFCEEMYLFCRVLIAIFLLCQGNRLQDGAAALPLISKELESASLESATAVSTS